MKRKSFLAGLSCSLLLTIVPQRVRARTTTILIGAGVSLQDALEEITPLFHSAHPEIRVRYNFASSGALQQQIQQGAPIDVFISAASRQMDALQNRGLLLANSRRNILTNRLVLIVPRNSTTQIGTFQQLVNNDVRRIAVGEPRSVPAGQYAEEVFRNLGILEQLRPKFVFGNSVRNVVASVGSGNADAGIVYLTDANISDQVRQVAIAPTNLHSPIVYPIAIVGASGHPDASRTYAQFLSSPGAQAIFRNHGFGIAR